MLMKWEDLEIGDKIKFRKEAINYYKKYESRPPEYYSNKVLTIIWIGREVNRFIIYYDEKCFSIKKDGRPFFGNFDEEVFEIIELKED